MRIDPEAPVIPELRRDLPSPKGRFAFPGIAPPFRELGRLADPDQVVAALVTTNLKEPFSQTHDDLRIFRWAQRAAPGS